jgi:hypothetical protein
VCARRPLQCVKLRSLCGIDIGEDCRQTKPRHCLDQDILSFAFSLFREDTDARCIGGGTLDQLIATSVVGLLILIPFFAFRALGEVVGERNLVRIFLEQRRKTQGRTVSSTMDYLPPSP